MKRKLIAAFLMFGFAGAADAAMIRCNGCTSTQMRDAARAAGSGDHTVYNLSGHSILAYEVEYDRELGVWRVLPQTVHPDVAAYFNPLADAYEETGGTLQAASDVQLGEVMPGDDRTAHDVVTDANFRGQLGDAILESPVMDHWVDLVGAAVGIPLGMSEGLDIKITITFEDGSKYVYNVTIRSGRGAEASPLLGSGRTATNQVIAEANTPEWGGLWRGEFAEMERLRDHMSRLGSSAAWGWNLDWQPYTMRCTWDGETLSCVQVP